MQAVQAQHLGGIVKPSASARGAGGRRRAVGAEARTRVGGGGRVEDGGRVQVVKGAVIAGRQIASKVSSQSANNNGPSTDLLGWCGPRGSPRAAKKPPSSRVQSSTASRPLEGKVDGDGAEEEGGGSLPSPEGWGGSSMPTDVMLRERELDATA